MIQTTILTQSQLSVLALLFFTFFGLNGAYNPSLWSSQMILGVFVDLFACDAGLFVWWLESKYSTSSLHAYAPFILGLMAVTISKINTKIRSNPRLIRAYTVSAWTVIILWLAGTGLMLFWANRPWLSWSTFSAFSAGPVFLGWNVYLWASRFSKHSP